MTKFISSDFVVWEATASLKQSIEVILCIELKQSYCEILESVPAVFAKLSWNFRPSLNVCSSLAGNWQYIIYHLFVDILSRHDLFWWPVPEKIAICLQEVAAFWDKISMFHLGQKEHCSAHVDLVMVHSAHSIVLLLASFDVVLPREREKPSWIDWTIEISPSARWDLLSMFPTSMSHFRASHHTTYCVAMCAMILDIILTSYAYMLSLRRARSPRHMISKTAHRHRSLNILKVHEPRGLSSRQSWSYQLHIVWCWLENARTRAQSLKKSRFSQFLLGWSPRWSWSITWGFEFSAVQSVDHDDWLTFMKHLVEIK